MRGARADGSAVAKKPAMRVERRDPTPRPKMRANAPGEEPVFEAKPYRGALRGRTNLFVL